MTMPQTIEATGHPVVADGDVKRMLTNGEWVRAGSGKTFESRPTSTTACHRADHAVPQVL
jgi:hypothetical protein